MKRIIFIMLLVMVLCSTLCSCSDDDDDSGDDDDNDAAGDDDSFVGSWWIESVDELAGFYQEFHNTSIDMDGNDMPQITYFTMGQEKVMKRAFQSENKWNRQTLLADESFAGVTSFMLDANDIGHLSFYHRHQILNNDNDYVLSYATSESGMWQYETVDPGSDQVWKVGEFNSLAVDSNNKIHISYRSGYDEESQNQRLLYVNNVDGNWEMQGNDACATGAASGSYTSIAIDADNSVHISHLGCDTEKNCLRYIITSEGQWSSECVPDTQDREHQTSIGSSGGQINIAFHRMKQKLSKEVDFSLNIAIKDDSEWTTAIIDPSVPLYCRFLSDRFLGLDGEGHAHIAYTGLDDEDNPVLKYATNSSGEWVTEIVDPSPNSGIGASIAVDSDGYVHISYYDNGNSSLKYATNRP